MDELVTTLVNQLDVGLREDFEERAAIMEYDAMLSRGHAECLALLDVLHRYPAVLTGVIVMRVELEGAAKWLLTTDIRFARQQLANLGGTEIGVLDLVAVIEEQYGGVALLTAAL